MKNKKRISSLYYSRLDYFSYSYYMYVFIYSHRVKENRKAEVGEGGSSTI